MQGDVSNQEIRVEHIIKRYIHSISLAVLRLLETRLSKVEMNGKLRPNCTRLGKDLELRRIVDTLMIQS